MCSVRTVLGLLAILTALVAFGTPTWIAVGVDATNEFLDGADAVGSAVVGHGLFSGFTLLRADEDTTIGAELRRDNEAVQNLGNTFFPFETDDGSKTYSALWMALQTAAVLTILLGFAAFLFGCRGKQLLSRLLFVIMALTAAVCWSAFVYTNEYDRAVANCRRDASNTTLPLDFESCESSSAVQDYGEVVVYTFFVGYYMACASSVLALLAAICF